MKQIIRHTLLFILAILIAFATVSCGGSETKSLKEKDRVVEARKQSSGTKTRSKKSKKRRKKKKKKSGEELTGPWASYAKYFEKYRIRGTKYGVTKPGFFHDPFRPRLSLLPDRQRTVDLLTKLQPLASAGDGDGTDSGETIEKTPLQLYALDQYRVTMIKTGIIRAEAALVDPDGRLWTINIGDSVGSNREYVEEIRQYEVLFRRPGHLEPITKSLKPPILELVKKSDEHLLMEVGR
ncbi:MAG: hypothetical protein CMH54_13470 [Myxococcales bacterium]|nr:hypothetical protein [Myxococcales bacterium]|tara:strand:+ start:228 stop:941 length:714 start_codon:yes stop_codon:yes gene_type:complete